MEERIPFRIGESIQLQRVGSKGAEGRFIVPLYGVCPEQSLITGALKVNGKFAVVGEGQRFTARLMAGGCAYGFWTEVLYSRMRPVPYLHLRYPREFERKEIRSAARVSVHEALTLRRLIDGKEGERSMNAVALDVSQTGLCAACDKPLLEVGEEISVNAELMVAGRPRSLKLPAVVRNISRAEDEDDDMSWRLGIQFVDLPEHESIVLASYVNEQLVATLG